MKKVYILLSRTNTVPARIIRLFKGGRFSHASISLEPSTDKFYSYARRKPNNPLRSGLVAEDIHSGVFSLYPNAPCALYELEVSDDAYERMKLTLEYFLDNYDKATYNMIGLIPTAIGWKIKRKLHLVCSQFVAVILSSSSEIALPKDPYLMCPNDFLELENTKLIFEGKLCECVIEDKANDLAKI